MKIQSRKFLPLMYQLAARLGTKSHDNRLFQGILNEVWRAFIDLSRCGERLWTICKVLTFHRNRQWLSTGLLHVTWFTSFTTMLLRETVFTLKISYFPIHPFPFLLAYVHSVEVIAAFHVVYKRNGNWGWSKPHYTVQGLKNIWTSPYPLGK